VGDVLGFSGQEIIDADDFMPLFEQKIGEVRAKEAGGAGNQNSHARSMILMQRPISAKQFRSAGWLGWL